VKDALEIAGKLGIGGGIGFLFGWLVVWWVEPTTNGGTGLLIVISVVFWMTIVSIISKLFGSKDQKGVVDEETEKLKQNGRDQSQPSSQPPDQWLS
jgi:hypothetical protein